MAKRPAVRRGRKNPNAGIQQAAEQHSVEPVVVVPTEKETSTEADLQLFPMSGAVDRTAELETRLALDKKLNAIIGTDEEESAADEKRPTDRERQSTKRGHANRKKEKSSKESNRKNINQTEKKTAHGKARQEDATVSDDKKENASFIEYSETGGVLFDAVLPDSHQSKKTNRQMTISAKGFGTKRTEQTVDHKAQTGEQDHRLLSDDAVSEETHQGTEEQSHSTHIHQSRQGERPDDTGANGFHAKADPENGSQVAKENNSGKASAVRADLSSQKATVSIYDYRQDKAAEEARIQAEVDRRVSVAQAEMEPQVIVSPRAVRRGRLTFLLISLGFVALALISIILGINYDRMNRSLKEANQELDFYKGLMNGEDTWTPEPADVAGTSGAEGGLVKKEDGTRRVYLTFDDGPSEVTVETLDILATYGVKATFFVNGKEDERSAYIYNRIVDEGHTLAMHGYTHEFDVIYASLDNFSEDMNRLRNLLYDRTGGRIWGKYYRFPGGSSTTTAKTDMKELASYLEREGVTYYDWNVYGGDDIDAVTMLSNIKASATKYNEVIILLHDAADKKATVEALPGIIEYLQGLEDTVLLPITDDTVPIQHGGL